MKKNLFSFAVMAMGATLLTGCLGDDSNGGDTPTEIVVTKGALVVNNGSSYQSIDGSLTFLSSFEFLASKTKMMFSSKPTIYTF